LDDGPDNPRGSTSQEESNLTLEVAYRSTALVAVLARQITAALAFRTPIVAPLEQRANAAPSQPCSGRATSGRIPMPEAYLGWRIRLERLTAQRVSLAESRTRANDQS
jgi:hypothetical protein